MKWNYEELMADFKPYLTAVLDNFTETEIDQKYSGNILHYLLEMKIINRSTMDMDKLSLAIKLLQYYAFQRKFGAMREEPKHE